jgi:hypothetical protein
MGRGAGGMEFDAYWRMRELRLTFLVCGCGLGLLVFEDDVEVGLGWIEN